MATTTNHPTKEVAVSPFSSIQPGLLPAGSVTELGTVVRSTLTAYEMSDGTFVAFQRVHGRPQPASPLVVIR